jgi:hypothetical protein
MTAPQLHVAAGFPLDGSAFNRLLDRQQSLVQIHSSMLAMTCRPSGSGWVFNCGKRPLRLLEKLDYASDRKQERSNKPVSAPFELII